MTENDLQEATITSYGILAHMGFKCVTEDEKDITEDLKKAVRIVNGEK